LLSLSAENDPNKPSFYLFHGSSLENWHSIINLGLKNFSNTKLMSHGAVHGPGVYLSPRLSVTSSYANPAKKNWPHSRVLDAHDSCQGICEIINRPSEIKTINQQIYVIPNEQHIATRYLMISPDRKIAQDSLQLTRLEVMRVQGPGTVYACSTLMAGMAQGR
jgi:hypothetical protein